MTVTAPSRGSTGRLAPASSRGSGPVVDADIDQVFSDPQGAQHVADLAVVDFLDGLARRHIVFVSWG